jgi:SAM-dependent methyltransferase
MRIGDALQWWSHGEQLAWRSLRAGTLGKAGLRPAIGAFMRPLTAPSRYPEYEQVFELLRTGVDLADPASWLLDVGSPKLFSLLVAARTRATVVGTDIWQPAIDEAEALRGGLSADASARTILGVMDAREPVPAALRPPDGLFAGAFSMSVVEHIEPDPGGDRLALQRISEVIRPGGRVVVSVPVDRESRSEHLQVEMYGRKSDDRRGRFFQRVYDANAIRELCSALSPLLALERCVLSEWPVHPIMKLQSRFPTAVGFAGASFALLANRFVVSAPSRSIPEFHAQGDVILELRRTSRN